MIILWKGTERQKGKLCLSTKFAHKEIRWNYGIFRSVKYDDITRFSILQIMYENYYHEQLAKISTCVKYSIDAYHKYILPFGFGDLNSNFHNNSPNVNFPRFSNSFLPFSLVFPHVSSGVSAVSFGFLLFPRNVSPVSYFRFCGVFYEQHFFKKRQAEIGKKLSKYWATPWG